MDTVDPTYDLTPSQQGTFEDQGFLKVESVFQGTELKALQESTEEVINRWAFSSDDGFFQGKLFNEGEIDPDDLADSDVGFLYHVEGEGGTQPLGTYPTYHPPGVSRPAGDADRQYVRRQAVGACRRGTYHRHPGTGKPSLMRKVTNIPIELQW